MDFGTRRVQAIRQSYGIIIPKALARALGIEGGDYLKFALRENKEIIIRKVEGEISLLEDIDREGKFLV